MRAAIDWSKGAPNKYAASFSEAERDAMFRKAAAHDLHVWTVRALDQIQVLEVALFTYLLLADGMAASEARERALKALGRPELPLGRLIEELSVKGVLPEGAHERVRSVAAERSWLFHQSSYDRTDALRDAAIRAQMFARLESIVTEAESLTAELKKAVSDALRGAGLTARQINARRGEAVQLWRAA